MLEYPNIYQTNYSHRIQARQVNKCIKNQMLHKNGRGVSFYSGIDNLFSKKPYSSFRESRK